ncbi:MAG TPA: hypothetical protein VI298_09320 [Geobacteraceae bacterium]
MGDLAKLRLVLEIDGDKAVVTGLEQVGAAADRSAQTTQGAVGNMAMTWKQFTAERMSEYMRLEGSHAAAMQRMSREWASYKATAGAAAQETAQTAQTATERMAASLGNVETASGRMAAGTKSATEQAAGSMAQFEGAIGLAMGALAALGASFSLAAVVAEVRSGIEAIDEFNTSVIQMSAILTSLQLANGTAGGSIADTYRQTKEYAEGVNNELLKIEPSTSLSIKGLQRINLELAKAGVAIDTNNAAQVEGFRNLANAAAVFSQGGKNEVMLQSEIMLLMQGQASAHSRLGSAISAMVGGDLKTWVEEHKQAGDFLEQMNKVLAGFGPASKDIANTWGAVHTSFETTVNIIQRSAFAEVFKEVVEYARQFNEWLKQNEGAIVNGVHKSWLAFKGAVETVVSIMQGPLWVILSGIGGLAVKILDGWGLIVSSVLPVAADEFKHLLDFMNAIVNLAYSFGLVMLDAVGAVGEALFSVGKAALQALTGDFKGAGETLQGMFSGVYVEKLKGNMDVVKGATVAITEEWQAMQDPMGKIVAKASEYVATMDKAKAASRTAPDVRQPVAGGYDVEAYEKELERFREADRQVQVAYDKAALEAIKNNTALQMEALKARHNEGLISNQAYLDAQYQAEKTATDRETELLLSTAQKIQQQLKDARAKSDSLPMPAVTEDNEKEVNRYNNAILAVKKLEKESVEAWEKVANAQAKANLNLQKYTDDSVKAARDLSAEWRDTQARLLEVNGFKAMAAAIQDELKYEKMAKEGKEATTIAIEKQIDAIKRLKEAQDLLKGMQNKLDDINISQMGDPYEKASASIHHRYQMERDEIRKTMDAFKDNLDIQKAGIETLNALDRSETEETSRAKLAVTAGYVDAVAGIMGGLASLIEVHNQKSFDEQKALNLGQAIMSTAAAVMQALASGPPPASYVAAAFAAATGAIQIAKIASTQYKGGDSAGGVSAGFSASGAAGGAPSGVGGSIGAPTISIHDSQTQASLQRLADAADNASVAIGRVADGLTKISDLFTSGEAKLLGGGLTQPGYYVPPSPLNKSWDNFFNDTKKMGDIFNPVNAGWTAMTGPISDLGKAMFGWGNDWYTKAQGISLGIKGGDFDARGYLDRQKDGGWFSDDEHATQYLALDSTLKGALSGYLQSIKETIVRGVVATGTSADFNLASLPDTHIQTSGRKPEDIQKDLEAWYTKAADTLAQTVTGLKDFTFYGESAFDALVRLSTSLQGVNDKLSLIGATLISSTLEGANAAYHLQDMFGGLDKFGSAVDGYMKAVFTAAQQKQMEAADAQRQVNVAFAEMGIAVPATRQQFAGLVDSLDLSTSSGQALFAALMQIAPEFGTVQKYAEEMAKAQKELNDNLTDRELAARGLNYTEKLYKLHIDQEKELADAREKGLDVQRLLLVQQLEYQKEIADLQKAAADEAKSTLSAALSSQVSVLEGLKSILGGDLSTLSPERKYLQLRASFAAMANQALAGDATALAGISQAGQDFLSSSRGYNASGAGYVDDYNRVVAVLSQLGGLDTTNPTLEIAQNQLSALQSLQTALDRNDAAQLSVLQDVLGVNSVTAGLMAQWLATYPATAPAAQTAQQALAALNRPSFDVGSPFIPYDMTADIHRGEKIIDAQSSAILSRYGIKVQAQQGGDTSETLEELKQTVAELKESNRQLSAIVRVLSAGFQQSKKIEDELLGEVKEVRRKIRLEAAR